MAQFTKDVPEMNRWAQSIGGLILNFGCLEFQTLRWIHVLGGEERAIKARRDGFSRRIDLALALMKKSSFPLDLKLRAQELWTEVKRLSQLRNQLAHNPLAQGRNIHTNETSFSIIDLKKMAPDGQYEPNPLSYMEITQSAFLAGAINRDLSSIIENNSNLYQEIAH